MLKVNIGCKNAPDMVAGSGDIQTIIAEIGAIIADIYTQLNANAPVVASAYKKHIVRLITDPDSPVWDGNVGAEFGMMSIIPVDDKG